MFGWWKVGCVGWVCNEWGVVIVEYVFFFVVIVIFVVVVVSFVGFWISEQFFDVFELMDLDVFMVRVSIDVRGIV